MPISGRLWPLHLKPKPDELLSSWLMRLSRAYGLSPHSFCSLVWPGVAIWNRDIDRLATPAVITQLAHKTGVSVQRALATTLRAYEGVVFERINVTGHTLWILPLGIWHRVHLRYGQQFCPCCLAEDEDPYFRRAWRLGFVTCCLRHRTVLLDRCPACGYPVNFQANAFGKASLALCARCGVDLANPDLKIEQVSNLELNTQRFLVRAVNRGWVRLNDRTTVYSHLMFQGLHLLVRMLASPNSPSGLLGVALSNTPLAEVQVPLKPGRVSEYADIHVRRILIFGACQLLQAWPRRFISFSRQTALRAKDLTRDISSLPFWLDSVVRESLDAKPYLISDVEVAHALRLLRKLGLRTSQRNVYAVLGHRAPKGAKRQLRRAAKLLR